MVGQHARELFESSQDLLDEKHIKPTFEKITKNKRRKSKRDEIKRDRISWPYSCCNFYFYFCFYYYSFVYYYGIAAFLRIPFGASGNHPNILCPTCLLKIFLTAGSSSHVLTLFKNRSIV